MTPTTILQILLALFWILLIPSLMGIVILRKEQQYTILDSLVGGYLIMLATGEIITLPMIYLNFSLTILTCAMALIFLFFAAFGILLVVMKKRTIVSIFRKEAPSIFLILAILIILAQLVTVILMANTDADDSFYVATATTGVYTNTIFSINPYTGVAYAKLPLRYVLSQFPTFLAVVSKLCLDLHPAIIAHSVFAPVFIVFAYVVHGLLAQKWFPDNKHGRGLYLFFVASLLCYSAFSVYNAGIFELTRIWQGKGFLAAAFLPFLFLLNLDFYDPDQQRYRWFWLFLTDLSCCYLSSMGVILAISVTAILGLIEMIRSHKPARPGIAILCMLPSLILGVIYVTMHMETL